MQQMIQCSCCTDDFEKTFVDILLLSFTHIDVIYIKVLLKYAVVVVSSLVVVS